jgi:outer membrane protein assembly factor BamB
MRPPRTLCCLTAMTGLLLVSSAGHADDWPQWLGSKRDSVWRETGILAKFPEGGPKVRWRAGVSAGYSGPAVTDGRVYLTDRVLPEGTKNPAESFVRRKDAIPGKERVLCFSEADGKPLWSYEYDCPYTISYPLGPRCTPVVHDGKAYTLGAEGNLFCFDAVKGTVLWSKDFKKDYKAETAIWGHAAHPLIDGKKLICMVGGEGSAVVAFDKDTGKEIWKSLTCKNLGYCPPTLIEAGGKRQLIIWHGEAVNSLDPESGSLYWTHPFQTYQAMAISTPRVAGDFLFLTSTFGASLALKLGADKPTAELAWKGVAKREGGTSFDSVFGSPFVQDGHIYGTSSDGELMCIKPETGERLWQTDKPNGKIIRCADVFIVKNGDRFFLWTEKGDLIIARLSPKGYEEISRAHILDPTSAAFGHDVLWCHPAFANKCFYVRNDKELVCVSLTE